MTQELRLYTWTLYQLSSIQQGIQAGHAAVELMIKEDNELTFAWAHQYKTMVLLNGGDLNELCELRNFLVLHNVPLPWATFYEDSSLGGCLTSIAMIVPERLYSVAENLRRKINLHTLSDLNLWELDLVHRIAASSKAR